MFIRDGVSMATTGDLYRLPVAETFYCVGLNSKQYRPTHQTYTRMSCLLSDCDL